MLLTDAGRDLMDRLERQRDIPSLIASFHDVIQAFGMTAFCIGDPAIGPLTRKVARWPSSWPQEWITHYAAQDYFSHDLIVLRMNAHPSPFRWSSNYASAGAAQKRVVVGLAELGMRDGLGIPIHGPRGVIAGVSIATNHYELSPRDERALHMASLYLSARVSALRPAASARAPRRLTPRERECLQWVASGKTDWKISQILNISEQTAHGYVQGALTKLDARTRAQAVALALSSSQILP